MAESPFLKESHFCLIKSRYCIDNVPKMSHPNPTCVILQGNVQGRGYGFNIERLDLELVHFTCCVPPRLSFNEREMCHERQFDMPPDAHYVLRDVAPHTRGVRVHFLCHVRRVPDFPGRVGIPTSPRTPVTTHTHAQSRTHTRIGHWTLPLTDSRRMYGFLPTVRHVAT